MYIYIHTHTGQGMQVETVHKGQHLADYFIRRSQSSSVQLPPFIMLISW